MIEPVSDAIYQRLVVDEKGWTFYREELPEEEQASFLLVQDAAQSETQFLTTQSDDLEPSKQARLLRPTEVRAETPPQDIDRVLYRLYLKANTALQEQGINILYVAFGLLHWTEKQGEPPLMAPLLLVPVRLSRESALHPFSLTLHDDETTLNPTLIEKLRTSFGITLSLLDDDRYQPLSAILAEFKQVFKNQPGWRVTDDAYLSVFQFHKLSMYRDLFEYEKEAKAHHIVRALAGVLGCVPDIEVDLPGVSELDRRVPSSESFQVLDADASQSRVILAAKRGSNSGGSFVVQGPPGTGKSQTIANIVAEFLALGKKVLFVSEKGAALEVVHRRLKSAGLDDFCLELHSHHANKKTILQELDNAMSPGSDSHRRRIPSDAFTELDETRSRLNQYADELIVQRKPFGKSFYEVNGLLAALRDLPDLTTIIPDIRQITDQRLRAMSELMDRLCKSERAWAQGDSHPWNGTLLEEVSLSQRIEIREMLALFTQHSKDAESIGQRLSVQLGVSNQGSVSGFSWLSEVASLLQDGYPVPANWLTDANLESIKATAHQMEAKFREHLELRSRMAEAFLESVGEIDAAAVASSLKDESPIAELALTGEYLPDRVFRDRDELERSFSLVILSAAELRQSAVPIAALLGEPLPNTIKEADRLIRLAELVTLDPAPVEAWRSNDAREQLRALCSEAEALGPALRDDLTLFEESFDQKLLDIATGQFIARYSSAGALRSLRPSHRRDRSQFTSLVKTQREMSFQEELGTLQEAFRLSKARQYFIDNESVFRELLGPRYVREHTDWAEALAAVDTFSEILQKTAGAPNETLMRLLIGRGGRSALSTHQTEELSRLRVKCKTALVELVSLAPGSSPALNPLGVEEISLTWVSDWATLSRLRLLEYVGTIEKTQTRRRERQNRGVDVLIRDLEDVSTLRDKGNEIADQQSRMLALFGELYDGLETDWRRIEEAHDWAERVRSLIPVRQRSEEFFALATSPKSLSVHRDMFRDAQLLVEEIKSDLNELGKFFSLDALAIDGTSVTDCSTRSLADWLEFRSNRLEELDEWITFKQVRASLASAGLRPLAAELFRRGVPSQQWEPALRKRVFTQWIDAVASETPVLRDFRSQAQETAVKRFRQIDQEQFAYSTQRIQQVQARIRGTIGGYGGSQAIPASEPAVLQRELRKKKRHKSLRRLFQEIPNLLMTLKPCLLMSPLSVSYFLPANIYEFDLVIFDEASQVRPQDAIGAIIRGKQVIVVGDPKQLPPSQFFEKMSDEISTDAEDDAGAYESILDDFAAHNIKPLSLNWHYRSRHEHLIAFSNKYFYDGKLITFPSADIHNEALVDCTHLTEPRPESTVMR